MAFPGERLGREVRVVVGRVAEPERARAQRPNVWGVAGAGTWGSRALAREGEGRAWGKVLSGSLPDANNNTPQAAAGRRLLRSYEERSYIPMMRYPPST